MRRFGGVRRTDDWSRQGPPAFLSTPSTLRSARMRLSVKLCPVESRSEGQIVAILRAHAHTIVNEIGRYLRFGASTTNHELAVRGTLMSADALYAGRSEGDDDGNDLREWRCSVRGMRARLRAHAAQRHLNGPP